MATIRILVTQDDLDAANVARQNNENLMQSCILWQALNRLGVSKLAVGIFLSWFDGGLWYHDEETMEMSKAFTMRKPITLGWATFEKRG